MSEVNLSSDWLSLEKRSFDCPYHIRTDTPTEEPQGENPSEAHTHTDLIMSTDHWNNKVQTERVRGQRRLGELLRADRKV